MGTSKIIDIGNSSRAHYLIVVRSIENDSIEGVVGMLEMGPMGVAIKEIRARMADSGAGGGRFSGEIGER
jgi:hypothetical protein